MNQQELEAIYEALARAIDEVGAGQGELYLAKVALALAETVGDLAVALAVIEACKTELVD